jgi:hypothetical protein
MGAARVVWWAAERTWGRRRGRGAAAKGRTRGGAAAKQRGRRGGRLGLGGERVGSHPSDRDQRPKPALTYVLPTPAYKSKKVLLFH